MKQLESASGAMLVQNRRSGSRLRMEITEALLDASPAPPHGPHDDAGTGSSNPLPSAAESGAALNRECSRTICISYGPSVAGLWTLIA
jgi:hypothetical protein